MKEQFFAKLETLIAEARRLTTRGFDEQEPEAATCHELILPLLAALGFLKENIKPEFKILGDSVDYLLKSERPLMFVETKSLLDCLDKNLFDKHREQVHRYIQNYRLSPEITAMAQPVKWILLTNFAQLHFIRVNEVTPSFSFKLDDLWPRREELWELLALENLEANRIDEVYDQHKKAGFDQQFLADLKRWRLLIANGFALRNQKRSLDEITLASQQLLDRFIFCRMLETQRLVEYNKLARSYSDYEVLYGRADQTFGEILRESLFIEIKNDFNTELFEQPLLCDGLDIDNVALSAVIGHEPLAPELAAQCGFESGQGELLAFRHLYRYDFSLMSSDVMGAVYERFLAHKLLQDGGRVVIEDTDELRKKEGIYYTPQYIVDYIVAHTLGEKIQPILAEAKTLLGYKNFKGAIAKIRELGEIKVLDPAMGSGSFLLRAFDALVRAYDDYNQECRRIKKDRNGHGALFDADLVIAEEVLEAPLHVLTENIFGVDLDKQAVEVAKLNLWLRYMAVNRDPFIERLRQKRGSQPLSLLPNLTHNLKCGNSLIADQSIAGDTAFDWAMEFPEIMGGTGNLRSSTGDSPVPVGDPPTGTARTPELDNGAGSQMDASPHSAGLAARQHGQVARATHSAPGATYSKRNLPHFEKPWAIYHVIINTIAPRKLSPAARDIVFDCILHWRERRYRLVAACVMPDHAHFIIQPGVQAEDKEGNPIFWPLAEILHSIKSYSAKEVNKLDKVKGTLWQQERYDRYMRSDLDLQEKFHYVCRNPWAAGLVNESEPWPWLWTPEIEAWQPYVPLNARTGPGGTGDSPVPVGDPPTGTGSAPAIKKRGDAEAALTSIPPGGSPGGAGGSPAPPKHRGFNVVIGNPPYNMLQPHNTADDVLAHLREHYVKVEFKIDLFQLFLQRAVSFLKDGSRLGYIVPTTILNNVYAESLRQWLTEQCCIERIAVCRNQVFADADVHTSILIFRKEPDAALRKKHEILTTEDLPELEENRTVSYSRTRQSRFAEMPGHVWNILLNEENAGLITKLASQSVPLKTVATINRGLITGNRDRYFATTKATNKHVPIIEGGDVARYFAASPSNFVLFERPESAGGCWDEEVHFAKHKIVIRQIAEKPLAGLLGKPLAVTGNIFTIRGSDLEDEFYLLGIINSRLTEFFWKTMFADFKTSFPQVTVFSLEQIPIKKVNKRSKKELTEKKNLVANVKAMLAAQNSFHNLPLLIEKKIHHSQRTPCNLAHYLEKDFAAAVKADILIDDVQSTGFVHEIRIESEGGTGHWPVPSGDPPDGTGSAPASKQRRVAGETSASISVGDPPTDAGGSPALPTLTLTATVTDKLADKPRPLPVLRLAFKDDALRQFIYAAWRQFLDVNSRKKKWTTGKKPEPIYPLLVNTLEPLVSFSSGAGDNLRAIRDLMKTVAAEAGSANLAAIELEIKKLDREIDKRVYELYGLTEAEIKIVEGTDP